MADPRINENLVGRLAVIEYGGDPLNETIGIALPVETCQFQFSGPSIDITNISTYLRPDFTMPWQPVLKDPTEPAMDQFLNKPQDRWRQYGAPAQTIYGNIRKGRVTLGGIATYQSQTPHIGNYVYVTLNRRSQFQPVTAGLLTFTGWVVDFSIDQQIRGVMKWSCQVDSDGDFDVTMR